MISREGVTTNLFKVKAVQEWLVPQNVKEVSGSLGLCSYYQCFVAKFAEIARPLHRLTEKGALFNWQDSATRHSAN